MWFMVVVCESWWLCVGHGGCVWFMVVVCGSWWSCVSDGGCVWVMVVVWGSWWLCGGCVCESREVSKDAIICQSTNDFSHPRLTVHYNSYCTPY